MPISQTTQPHGSGPIHPERGEAVYEGLRRRVRRSGDESAYWTTDDTFGPAVIRFPAALEDGTREEWDRHFDAGDEDLAARLMVQASYRWFGG